MCGNGMVSLAQMDNPSFSTKIQEAFLCFSLKGTHDQTSAFSAIKPRSRAFNDQWFLCIVAGFSCVHLWIKYSYILYGNAC